MHLLKGEVGQVHEKGTFLSLSVIPGWFLTILFEFLMLATIHPIQSLNPFLLCT